MVLSASGLSSITDALAGTRRGAAAARAGSPRPRKDSGLGRSLPATHPPLPPATAPSIHTPCLV